MRNYLPIISALLGITLIFACSPRQEEYAPPASNLPAVVESDIDLMTQWRSLVKENYDSMDFAQAKSITQKLASKGPEALEPLFQVVSSSEENPVTKMLAIICLDPYINEGHLERLTALTLPEHNQATRGFAVHLLGRITDQRADARLRELFSDPDRHVSKVATMVLLRRNDETAVQKAIQMWKEPSTTDNDRKEIVLAFPASQAKENLYIYEESLCREGLDNPTYSYAIQMVGTLGGTSSLPKIEACLENVKSPELRSLLEGAKSAIVGRNQQVIEITPAPVSKE
jgi:hypothetical protein